MAKGGLELEAHFDSMGRQAGAARFGMWVFLASEVLLFGALFGLYAAYRAEWPLAFSEGVKENDAVLGTANTLLLILGSLLVALGAHRLAIGKPRSSCVLVSFGALIGLGFLLIKTHEYMMHFSHGIYPGGHGEHFAHAPAGSPIFFTLYFGMTGLHGIHVAVGSTVLAACAVRTWSGRLAPHALDVAALYWHLVDGIWIFLWPLFYLMRR